MNRKKISSRGLSYIEVLISLTILAVIAAILFPSLSRYRASTDLKSFSSNLVQDLKLAKETAKSMEGSKVKFQRIPEDMGKDSYPIIYEYFEIRKVDDTLIKRVIVPTQLGITGVPFSDEFSFRENGTLDDSLTLVISSSGIKMEGVIQINKTTGSIDINYRDVNDN